MIVWCRLRAKVKIGLRIDRDEVCAVPIVNWLEQQFFTTRELNLN
jgi:hypothetical protein